MTRLVCVAPAASLAATGCGRVANSGGPVAATAAAAAIRSVDLSPGSTGSLLTVTAVAPTQGYWNAALAPLATDAPGQRAFTFAATPPPAPAPVSTERSREITAATSLSQRELAGIREIAVHGAGGAQVLRR